MNSNNHPANENQKLLTAAQFGAYVPNSWTDTRYTPAKDLILSERFVGGLYSTYFFTIADLYSTGKFCLECFEEDVYGFDADDQIPDHDHLFFRKHYSTLAEALTVGRELISTRNITDAGVEND